MKAIGIFGSVEFDGNWVVIQKQQGGFRGVITREIALTDISSVTYKPASLLYHGFFQVTLAGTPAAPVKRRGTAAGRPDRHDLDSVSFSRSRNLEFQALEEAIRAARRGRPPGLTT